MEHHSKMKSDFDFSIWKEECHNRAKERGRHRKQVLSELDTALETLAVKYDWDEIYIFGSLIKEGKFLPRSDVDIAVKGLDKFKHFAFVGDISALLNREVDVIRLEDCHFRKTIVAGGLKWNSKRNSSSS